MKKLHDVCKGMAFLAVATSLMLSCSTDSDSNQGDKTPLSQAELHTILQTDDVSGSVDMVMAELYSNDSSTGKIASECYEVVNTDKGFTATFNNCVLNTTDNVNGTLNVVYETGSQQAVFTATFSDFYIGDIKVNGSRTYSIGAGAAQNSVEFTVVSDIELVLADESVIEEVGTKTLAFTFGETLETSTLAITGNWTIEMDGNTYVLEVDEDLVGTFGCDNLVSGLLYVGKNGLGVTVDFGDGSCDNLATIIYPDDTHEEITLGD